jgi:putative hemolysin
MQLSSLWFSAQFNLSRIPHVFKLKSLHRKVISPFINIDFENDYYQVKTASTADEIIQVLALRFEVFFREFSGNKVEFSLFPYDVDVYDFICDHLIVKDKNSGQVVACYRLLSSKNPKKQREYYSENEFYLSNLFHLEGNKLELGRACVHKEYRNGAVISLLWKGLLDYAKKSETRYMFGCSSINQEDFGKLPLMMKYFEEKEYYLKDLYIGVKPDYELKFKVEASKEAVDNKVINSLMHMYLMAGAKLSSNLAFDKEMNCIDVFTLMDLEKLPASFRRKFS